LRGAPLKAGRWIQVQAGAEGVVLGCTEIELLISATDSPVPVFPTTRLHVEAAVEASLAICGSV